MDVGQLVIKLMLDNSNLTKGFAQSSAIATTFAGSIQGSSSLAAAALTKTGVASEVTAGQIRALTAVQAEAQAKAAMATLAERDYATTVAKLGVGSAEASLAEARLAQARIASTEATKAQGLATSTLGSLTGGLINPMTVAAGAGAALSAVLVESVRAAADEQQVLQGLSASLQANVPAWSGSTDAIENWLSTAQRASAFSRDTLTGSLEHLVGATHNVATAEALVSTATNLARYRNEDLATATEQLVAIQGGNFRSLRALGISTKGVTDSMTAFAAINRVVAGQDTAYLGTEAGQMSLLENSVHDLEVSLGQRLLPVLKNVVGFLNSALPAAMDDASVAAGNADDVFDRFFKTLIVDPNTGKIVAMSGQAADAQTRIWAAAAAQQAAIETARESASLGALTSYYARATSLQMIAQQAANAAGQPYYADAQAQLRAHNDLMLTEADNASAAARSHAQAAFNAETAIAGRAAAGAFAATRLAGVNAAVAYGQGLASGQSAVDSGLKQMLGDMKHTLSVPKQIAKLEGELSSQALAKALRDGRPQVRTDAIAVAQDIGNQLTALGVSNRRLSGPAAHALETAMKDAQNPTPKAAEDLQATVAQGLAANYYSLGYNVAQTYVQGIQAALKVPTSATRRAGKDDTVLATHQTIPAPKLPPIHAFALGGIVPGAGPQLAIVHGREWILPENAISQAAAGPGLPAMARGPAAAAARTPIVIEIRNVTELDGEVIAEKLDRKLFQLASGFTSGFQANPGITGA